MLLLVCMMDCLGVVFLGGFSVGRGLGLVFVLLVRATGANTLFGCCGLVGWIVVLLVVVAALCVCWLGFGVCSCCSGYFVCYCVTLCISTLGFNSSCAV